MGIKYNPADVMKAIHKDVMRVVKKAPRAIGVIAVNHFEENFEKGGFVDKTLQKWKPRKNDTDPGRGVLIGKQSGKLMRATRIISANPSGTIVGNTLKYAGIHNRGGTINHPGGTAYFPKAGKAVFVKNATAKRYNKLYKKEMPRTKPHPIPIPQRKFIGASYQLNVKIAKYYIKQFSKNLK
jgi:phage gpG-like protein